MLRVATLAENALAACRAVHGAPRRLVVAFSGGRDSTVLLHLLATSRAGDRLSAVHVNHGLHPSAGDWEQRCAEVAASLGVPFRAVPVSVGRGDGPEAEARRARYAALAACLAPGDWLLTAHHADDQAETLLLNLMRGSGVDGLRAAALFRALPPGLLVRPLLAAGGDDIDAYARAQGLDWIDDPSNCDETLDRNYLRRRVLPVLARRWPAASRQMARSAGLLGDAAELAAALAASDIDACGDAGRLSLSGLRDLSPVRRANALRHACRTLGLALPTRQAMAAIESDLLPAREDATPCVTWGACEARRYRGYLYLLATRDDAVPPGDRLLPGAPVTLSDGALRLEAADGPGISAALAHAGLDIAYRAGGEALKVADEGRTQAVKKLLQDAGIVPWMRARVPLLYAAGELVAVGDLWASAAHRGTPGFTVHWDDKPPLY